MRWQSTVNCLATVMKRQKMNTFDNPSERDVRVLRYPTCVLISKQCIEGNISSIVQVFWIANLPIHWTALIYLNLCIEYNGLSRSFCLVVS